VPTKFVVSGLPVTRSSFELNGKACELALTLNGSYVTTPSGSYSMISEASSEALAYQVILQRQLPKAEFQVFRFHESPAIRESDLERLRIKPEDFRMLTEEHPRRIAAFIEADMLPSGVAKFLSLAKKCTSN